MNKLDYSTAPAKTRLLRGLLIFCAALSPLIAFLTFAHHFGGLITSADIRLDTGDLRYCCLGIPVSYRRMSEPERSTLLSLASKSSILTPQWHTCVKYPLRSSNNPDLMCRGWYFRATIWAKQNPELTRVMLEDVAQYIRKTSARKGLPPSCTFLSGFYVQPDNSGAWVINPNWKTDQEVVAYLKAKGLGIPATQPGR